ncbi:CPBP family intramembrane metalloprotease [Candidatus Woesearchaeota archaeon]|nr:CPBP family intramembrane metalloprotease [Candidatus Woesearchaeota archaeon]
MDIKKILRESLFLLLILLAVLEITGLVPGEINLLKKFLSWALVGYLLYYLSFTRILFNKKDRLIDVLLLVSLYAFAFKDISHSIVNESFTYFGFIKSFFYKYNVLNEIMFYAGSVFIFLIAVYSGFRLDYLENSILGLIRGRSKQRSLKDNIIDSGIIYLIFLFLSYFIFIVVMEWLSVAIDSLVIVGAIVYYFIVYFVIRKPKQHESFIDAVIKTGDEFITMFLELFHDKKTIFFGISGLIVMHAIIDIGNFISPYLLNLKESFYLTALLEESHMTLYELIMSDLSLSASVIGKASVVFAYVQNCVAIILLLIIPFYIWYRIFKKKPVIFRKFDIALFFSSMVVFLFMPVFRISALKDQVITGVDITTQTLPNLQYAPMIALASLLWFLIIFLFSMSEKIKIRLEEVIILSAIVFLVMYIYYFFNSTLFYYLDTIKFLFFESKFVLMMYLALYLCIITLFYVSGIIIYIFEVLSSEHVSFQELKRSTKSRIVLVWSLFLVICFIILINLNRAFELITLMISSMLLSFVLFRYEKKLAKHILTVNLVLDAFLIIVLIAQNIRIRGSILDLASRAILTLIVIPAAIYFRPDIRVHKLRMFIAIALAGLFGGWFHLINEPLASLISSSVLYIALLSLLIGLTEELIFRLFFLKSAMEIYSPTTAVVVQAVFFGMIHLLSLKAYWLYFGPVLFFVWHFSLMIYGLVMGILSVKENRINPVYAITCHALTVFILTMLG